MTKGFVYILCNAAMPGVLKIGFSVKVPTERVDELFTTGVPEPFRLSYYCLVENAEKLESQIHRNLSAYRHRGNREFFRIELEAAVQSITNLCKPEHEWCEEQPQSVDSNQHSQHDDPKPYEIKISSRHDIESEINEMTNFTNAAQQQSLAPYVRSLFYDSNSCCCYFELDEEVGSNDPIAKELFEIALETIAQFEWFGQIQHSKQHDEDPP